MDMCNQIAIRGTLMTLIIAGSAPTIDAQVSMKVYAHTKLAAGTKSIAANTDVTGGASLKYSAGGTCRPSASLSVTVTGPSVVRFNCSSSSQCSPAPGASGSIRVRLTAPGAIAGFLVGNGDCPGFYSGMSVDVGSNGTEELQASSQFKGQRLLETPLVVGPAGVDVIVTTHAAAASLFLSCSASITVGFLAATSTQHLRLIGTPCGPELKAHFTQTHPFFAMRNFRIDVAKANQTSSWIVFGSKQQVISIPPLGCKLYTDVVVPLWAPVDAAGKTSMNILVPSATTSGQAYVQFVQATLRANRMEWNTSQAMLLRL